MGVTEVRTSYWHTTDAADDADDGNTQDAEVTREQAEAAWAPEARRILTRVAATYQGLIEYAELASEIQESSGIHTRRQVRSWIVPVLDQVARLNHDHQEPALTALVTHKGDGTVGTSYDLAMSLAGAEPIDDPVAREKHAAQARLDCYHWADANVPAGGGRPELSPRFQQVLARQRKERREAEQPTICPNCFMQIPPTGLCDNCA